MLSVKLIFIKGYFDNKAPVLINYKSWRKAKIVVDKIKDESLNLALTGHCPVRKYYPNISQKEYTIFHFRIA